MKKKYLFPIYEKCIMCNGKGHYTHTEANFASFDNVGTTEELDCHVCNGAGEIEIKPSDKRFLKLYKKELSRQMDLCLAEFREAKNNEARCAKNYSIFCKEYDKIINKK